MKKLKTMVLQSLKYIPVFFVMGFLYTDIAFANEFAKAWNSLMKEYRNIVAGVAGIGALSSLLIFIVHMFQLASLGSAHAMTRRKILNNILISGVCTALLGAIGIIYVLIYQTVWFG